MTKIVDFPDPRPVDYTDLFKVNVGPPGALFGVSGDQARKAADAAEALINGRGVTGSKAETLKKAVNAMIHAQRVINDQTTDSSRALQAGDEFVEQYNIVNGILAQYGRAIPEGDYGKTAPRSRD